MKTAFLLNTMRNFTPNGQSKISKMLRNDITSSQQIQELCSSLQQDLITKNSTVQDIFPSNLRHYINFLASDIDRSALTEQRSR